MGYEIETYYRIFRDAYPKSEIIRYIINRLFGDRVKFKQDVYVKNEYGIFNCGRSMGNVRVAVDPSDKIDIREIPHGTFIDIGAHIGKHSIKVARDNPDVQVVAIEPTPETYKLLLENIKINSCDNIKAWGLACSDKEGIIEFNLDVSGSAMNSGVKRNGKKIQILGVRLDDCGLKNIKVIKVDVEGMELKVLQGAKKILRNQHPIIFFEAWDRNSFMDVKMFLIDNGYHMFQNVDIMNWAAI